LANELIVSNSDDELQIAILDDRRLVEFHREKRNNLFSVGDIFLGKVRQIKPTLNAAFVDIGYNRDAFLHYTDLGPQFQTLNRYVKSVLASRSNITPLSKIQTHDHIHKLGKIDDILKINQVVLVQITKEAISTKGQRLQSQLSIAGEYLILLPFGEDVSVSRKFKSQEERVKLRKFLEGIRPNNVGLIVRTAAEGRDLQKLRDEVTILLEKWDRLVLEIAEGRTPKKALSEIDRTSSILRDMLSYGFDAIYTDDPEIYDELNEYLARQQPDNQKNLVFRKTKSGLFETFGIEKQIKTGFGKTVNLSNGSYLIIEHTEALHVIDVNSGSQRINYDSPEENTLRVNMEAAAEVARQLRLRDMGGIIVIDFIDQRNMDNRRRIYEHLRQMMSHDRAKHTILPMSRFGLIQITRQRVRPEVNIITDEQCPTCNGTGRMQPSVSLIDNIQRNVDYLARKNHTKKIKLLVNPYVAAYLKAGFPSIRQKWLFQYRKWIQVVVNNSLPFTTVRYFDENDEELNLD